MALRYPSNPLCIYSRTFAQQGLCLGYPKTTRLRISSGAIPRAQHSHPSRGTARFFRISNRRYGDRVIVCVPPMAESITEGTLNQFRKQAGDFVDEDEELVTVETDKIDVSVNAHQAGIIRHLLVGEGCTVTVGQAIAEIQPADEPSAYGKETDARDAPKPDAEIGQRAKKEHAQQPALPVNPAPESTFPPAATAGIIAPEVQPGEAGPSRAEDRVKMTRIRQRTAHRLKESQNTAAFLTTFNEVNMSPMIEFHKRNKNAVLEKHGVKLGFMGSMARASALALKEVPPVNASIENNDTIVYRDYVDLSVAVAIPKGLVTPVLRNIESMSIVAIEKGIAALVKKAREGKLTMDDLRGGSFTISNSGIWGSLLGTPILNAPQTAVLGTYGIQDRPVAVEGQVKILPMMYIALTYDHRVIDGREAVKFLNCVKKYLQDPETMLFQ